VTDRCARRVARGGGQARQTNGRHVADKQQTAHKQQTNSRVDEQQTADSRQQRADREQTDRCARGAVQGHTAGRLGRPTEDDWGCQGLG
jgi:hypothetical protein